MSKTGVNEAKIRALIAKQRELVRKDYWRYCELVHTDINGTHQWVRTKHLMFVTKEVQKFIETDTGNPYDILGIHLPVQTGKSFTLTETLPSWFLGCNPTKNVIVASYNDEFAQKFGRKNLDKVETFGKVLFDIEVSRKKKSNDTFEIEGTKGGMISRGIQGGITGNPAQLIIIDDPVKNREEANSETTRNKIWNEWESSIRTRIAAGGKIIVIMSRWHEDDLIGRLESSDPFFRNLVIPMECESDDDPLGRQVGDSIAPELGKDNEWLKKFKEVCLQGEGLSTWNSLYQGRPSSEKGNIIKKEWWQYYDELPRIDLMVMSVDCAFEGKQTSDKVAIQVWGKTGANVYLVDSINERMGFNDTVKAIRSVKAKYPDITMTLIEKKANGAAVIDTLRSEIAGIIPIEPRGSKIARVEAVTPYIESGNVYLPRFQRFTEEFVDQCSTFPRGKNDDMVDAMSQMLTRLKDYKAHPKLSPKKKNDFEFENDRKSEMFGFKVPKTFFKF